ncbi:MAG: zinc-binding dehydrogenase [Mycobacterium sp.]
MGRLSWRLRAATKARPGKGKRSHHAVNTRGKTAEEHRDALEDLTGRRDADAILDCAGAEDGLALGAAVLAREGALTCVGLMGQKVVLPLLPFTNGEKSYFGSFWETATISPKCCARGPGTHQAHHYPGGPRRRQRQAGGNWRAATSWAAPSWSSTEPLASGTDIPAVLSPTADCSTGCGGWGVGVPGCGGGCR